MTIVSKISVMPIPSFAEAKIAPLQSKPIISSISPITRSGSAPGKSILFKTGIISRLLSRAKYTLARVCASTPWDASTTNNAPSQATRERDTS